MRELYWFQTDLRLQDNPGLLHHANADTLLCVYCWPDNPGWCNLTGIGRQRERFLLESLAALRRELGALGQELLVLREAPERALPLLANAHGIDRVGTSRTPGYYENRRLDSIADSLQVPLLIHEGNTLYHREQLDAAFGEFPGQYTPFRKVAETLDLRQPVPAPDSLPPPPSGMLFPDPGTPRCLAHPAFPLRGGSPEGQRRLRGWIFERGCLASYKETRNYLGGLDGSSAVSPWLANGCLSVREVAAAIRAFEAQHGASESSDWLMRELLWREFFHWRAYADGGRLFSLGGPRRQVHQCTFEARDFARWCQGDTDYPLVNALMHQLLKTGWMSNRGRQIAASCLVNEFKHDWRYGAAFFEKHLIDYDVASNYGNWQYLAGVGADPRGGRHFNLDKQAEQYDPDGSFTASWDGYRPKQPRYVTDAADWPLEAG